jgi:TIR domain
MRVSDKFMLIDKVGRALQAKYSYDEIDAFFHEFQISPPPRNAGLPNSKWVYSKAALQGAPTDILVKIAQELDINVSLAQGAIAIPPRNWKETSYFRLFISHISKDKDKATRLKDCLLPYAISGFVAHEDIHPTLEWQNEIERALHAMDAFVAIHTHGFSASVWTQQEIGFAVGRGVKIISFKMGEDPAGFISKRQALARGRRTAEQVAKEIDTLLSVDELTFSKLLAAKKAHGLVTVTDNDIPF